VCVCVCSSGYVFDCLTRNHCTKGCPFTGGWDLASGWIDGLVQREQQHAAVRSIHHFGDLAYAEGVAHQWEAWLTALEPAASRWPLMIAVGNHEYDYDLESSSNDPSGATTSYHPVWGNFGLDSGGECAVPVVKRFQMPDTGNSVFWYSYDSGLVHTIVLSSEHDLGSQSDQHEWFRKDLKNVDRTVTPWLVVELHRPLYEDEAYWAQNNVGIGMRDEIENLLMDYQVDLVLSGHYHAYHRS
jgi:acid phosphatase type 7